MFHRPLNQWLLPALLSCLVGVATARADTAAFFTQLQSDGTVDQVIVGFGPGMHIRVEPFDSTRLMVRGLNGTTFGHNATSRLINIPSGDLIVDGKMTDSSSVEAVDLQFMLNNRLQILDVDYVTVERCFLFDGHAHLLIVNAQVTDIDLTAARNITISSWWTNVSASAASVRLKITGRGSGCYVKVNDGTLVGQSLLIYGTNYRDNIDLNRVQGFPANGADAEFKIYGYGGNDFAYLKSCDSRFLYMNGSTGSDSLDYKMGGNKIVAVSTSSVETVK
ncbi:MAG: hypothetical protein KDB14_28615 [Planctomycetales bacterium]|nr:hypothetical protein [Planctomycetales bacterium]